MPHHVQNTAYDLSLFDDKRTDVVALKPNKKAQKVNRRREKLHALLTVAVYVAAAVLFLAVVGFSITGNVQLTELNSQIAEQKTRLAELQSEQVRLQSELASKTSIANVNAFAIANGMTAADNNQICYITISSSDAVTVSEENAGWLTRLWQMLTGFFS